MKTDYMIVGDGYAAMFFAHQLIKHKKKFLLFSEGKTSASQVSAGIVNPVVLKKFTTFWKAKEQIQGLKHVLLEIQSYTGHYYLVEQPIHRIFHDEKERELWLKKTKNDELSSFLDKHFYSLPIYNNTYHAGRVLHSARLDVSQFFEDMYDFLEKQKALKKEYFDYSCLNPEQKLYKDIKYETIVFAEGIGVKHNPYFKDIPIHPNKGHHIRVALSYVPNQEITVKKKHFLFPQKDGKFYYGGTYDRQQSHHGVDEIAIAQLENGLKEFYPFPFDVIEEHFGFRPTVKDRRPIIGAHKMFPDLYVFNGLGARGVLNASYFSSILFEAIENKIPLPEEVTVDRFYYNQKPLI